jgi:1,4-alpha-glucan branching enzyme
LTVRPTEGTAAGMGAIAGASSVTFRVWAPHASAVFVTGSFNNWSADAHPMVREENGCWFADISSAKIGSEYCYRIINGDQQLFRIDPYARQVTSSVGNAVVVDNEFDWSDDNFQMPAINQQVIYELHLGTFRDEEAGT